MGAGRLRREKRPGPAITTTPGSVLRWCVALSGLGLVVPMCVALL